MERDDRDKARGDVAETNRRLGAAADSREGHQIVAGKMAARAQARKKYQFEATASDDELEDELDENLDETLRVTRRLKMMATAMGDEVNNQNTRISSITDKAHNLDARIQQNTSRLNTM
jgi:hypothetical protein